MDVTIAQPQQLLRDAVVVASLPSLFKYFPFKYFQHFITTISLQDSDITKSSSSVASSSSNSASKSWLDIYPVEEEYIGYSGHVTFVNVGGSNVQQCQAIKSWYPHLPGRFVVQDDAATLAGTARANDIELMTSNVLDAQLVRGAKFYCLSQRSLQRPRAECRAILGNQGRACEAESRILIDTIISNDNISDQTSGDGKSLEMAKDEWLQIIAEAGLKVTKFLTYDYGSGRSIVECVSK